MELQTEKKTILEKEQQWKKILTIKKERQEGKKERKKEQKKQK